MKIFWRGEEDQEINRVVDRTAKATGVSKRTVTNIHKAMTQEKYFLTPTKRYIASRVRVNVDSFDNIWQRSNSTNNT